MGVLRILFTAEDLGRVRVVSGPEPMWEIVLSLYRLRGHGSAVVFDGWRRLMRGRAPGSVQLLTDLIPRDSGYFPDFLTPVLNGPSLEAGIEELRATPRHRLHADLLTLNALHPHLPRWTGGLARGERDTVEALSVAVRQYFDACLAASWPRVHVRLDAERARLTRTVGEFGVTHVLRDLHPTARWRPPVLEVAYPVDRELRLAGRGLVLVPSFFCWGSPTTFRDRDLRPVLVIPIQHDIGWAEPTSARSLSALLGRSRSLVLAAIAAGPCSTTELAKQTGTPLATASRQAAVLRDAGLIATRRCGQSVLHSITPLGLALLAGS